MARYLHNCFIIHSRMKYVLARLRLLPVKSGQQKMILIVIYVKHIRNIKLQFARECKDDEPLGPGPSKKMTPPMKIEQQNIGEA